ncbi:MAG TPA: PEP/pyruvate-binding domain-containing protein, partial [Pirellulaceae bacterium]|nr:PEP/pyruvate-binding domain-containing protein [Pirellulaceae bacterium]
MSFDESQLVFSFRPGRADCPPARVDLLGGKGASLAALCCAGFPVPPGFTLSTANCRRFESSSKVWPEGLETAVRNALADLERETQRVLGRGPRPLLVAVRSGAAVSMPGMMDTILNCGLNPSLAEHYGDARRFWTDYAAHIRQFAASVAGVKLGLGGDDNRNPAGGGALNASSAISDDAETLEPSQLVQAYLEEFRERTGREFPIEPWDALKQAIDAVFASWNSRRAQVYRERHRISGLAGTAVNVQMMFPAERAGVLFTVDPNSPQSGRMVLEASWGLGEAVVSGEVTPDVYHLDAESLRIVETTPGQRPRDEPALTEQQTIEIGRLGSKVAEHLGFPADIEWAVAEGQIALLQARAIRGLDVQLAASELLAQERRRLTESAGGRTVVWVAHNLGETLPAPTPLTWDCMRELMSGDGPLGRLYRILGFEPARRMASESMLELIGGRIYADPRRAAQMFFGEIAFTYDPDGLLRDPRTLDGPPSRLDLDQSDPWLFLRLPRLFWKLWRAGRIERRLQATTAARFTSAVIAPIDAHVGQTRRRDLQA